MKIARFLAACFGALFLAALVVQPAAAASNPLTLHGTVFGTSVSGYGQRLLPTGYATYQSTATGNYTFEARVTLPSAPGQIQVAMGGASTGWFGASGDGNAVFAATALHSTSVQIADGATHTLAMSFSGSTLYGFVDGVLVVTATGETPGAGEIALLVLGANGSYGWAGTVDEAVFWSGAKYTSAYTPRTTPYTGSEGMAALWHLDGDGTDSAGAAPVGATTYTLTGPSSGYAGTASAPFTITAAGALSVPVTVTPSDAGNGGTFSPSSETLAAGTNTSASFTYMAASGGAKSISTSSGGALTDPSALSFSASARTLIAANNPGLLYSTGGWNVTGAAATSFNPGVTMRTTFTGTSCSLNFDISKMYASDPSVVSINIDGQGRADYPLSSSTITCAMPASTSTQPQHTLEMRFVAGANYGGTGITKWDATAANSTAVVLTGLTLDSGGVVTAPAAAALKVAVFSDSFGEGVRTKNGGASDGAVSGNDATLAWPVVLGRYLGAEVTDVGFGGQGFSVAGRGGVPVLSTSYASIYSGVTRNLAAYDAILFTVGVNDASNTTTSAITALINGLIVSASSSCVIVGISFSGMQSSNLQAAIAASSAPSRVHYYDATTLSYVAADGIGHPDGAAGSTVIAPAIATYVRSLLSTTTTVTKPPFRPGFH